VATDKDFVDYVVDQTAIGDALTYKKMFGEYGLYHGGKIVALACDNSLFVKPSSASEELAPSLPQRSPYPGAKKYAVADELLDDPDALRELFLATSAALPLPKPKARPHSHGKKTHTA
jgi:TfoX/Sxy family transcriptional regulator of competence genes